MSSLLKLDLLYIQLATIELSITSQTYKKK